MRPNKITDDGLGALSPRAAGVIREANAADGIPFRAKSGHVHRTWARTFSSLPELYLQPESEAEIEKIVNLARRCRRRVTVVGCGHSPSDLTCTSGWLVNLDNYNKVLDINRLTGVVRMQSGIRLYALAAELERVGLAMPSLGSINEQSIAGAISTGTHGSSLQHGLISDDVVELKLTLGDGTTRSCSATEDPDLFRAALLSLGALGIISEVSFRAVPRFSLAWYQTIDTDKKMMAEWDTTLWTQDHFVRVWWFPYMRKAVIWRASEPGPVIGQDYAEPEAPRLDPPASWYGGTLGYLVYHNLLSLAQLVPRILPWVEWFVFGMQYGFKNGTTIHGVQPSREALLMDCLYSQFVNEWAIPLSKGPEVLMRLGAWLNKLKPGDEGYVEHGIPFSADGLWVHSPVEVRVADTSLNREKRCRPWLDPTVEDGPTLYLNATLYRPYHRDPPSYKRYYEAFEWLMKDMGGRPHWAKNFSCQNIEELYGENLQQWRAVRDRADPEGMFVGPWHRRLVLEAGDDKHDLLPLEEAEVERRQVEGGGIRVTGDCGGRK
ncbi:D-arabinono-1,4-lactone oxidase [Pyricularia grisea]|nr:D-arabinono-1,4-lactone oxidase [Pyricularia grisea]